MVDTGVYYYILFTAELGKLFYNLRNHMASPIGKDIYRKQGKQSSLLFFLGGGKVMQAANWDCVVDKLIKAGRASNTVTFVFLTQ